MQFVKLINFHLVTNVFITIHAPAHLMILKWKSAIYALWRRSGTRRMWMVKPLHNASAMRLRRREVCHAAREGIIPCFVCRLAPQIRRSSIKILRFSEIASRTQRGERNVMKEIIIHTVQARRWEILLIWKRTECEKHLYYEVYFSSLRFLLKIVRIDFHQREQQVLRIYRY